MTDFNPEAFNELALDNDQTNDGFLSSSDYDAHYNEQFAKDCASPVTMSTYKAHETLDQVRHQAMLAEKNPRVSQQRRNGLFVAVGVNGVLASASSIRELKQKLIQVDSKCMNKILWPIPR